MKKELAKEELIDRVIGVLEKEKCTLIQTFQRRKHSWKINFKRLKK